MIACLGSTRADGTFAAWVPVVIHCEADTGGVDFATKDDHMGAQRQFEIIEDEHDVVPGWAEELTAPQVALVPRTCKQTDDPDHMCQEFL